jgi:hypothetical protein
MRKQSIKQVHDTRPFGQLPNGLSLGIEYSHPSSSKPVSVRADNETDFRESLYTLSEVPGVQFVRTVIMTSTQNKTIVADESSDVGCLMITSSVRENCLDTEGVRLTTEIVDNITDAIKKVAGRRRVEGIVNVY